MTEEQAQIILSAGSAVWGVLVELIKEEQGIMRERLEKPENPRDLDLFYKGGINFGEQILDYPETARKILSPKKEED